MEKVRQNQSDDTSGTFLVILASVAVLLLVGFMVATVLLSSSTPRTLVYAPSEPTWGAESGSVEKVDDVVSTGMQSAATR